MEEKEIKISLARLFFPVTVLGPGKRIGLWLTGCQNRCIGCISPELQNYDPEREITINNIMKMISSISEAADGFTISGGEPFYYPEKLYSLVKSLMGINDDILIYTGYTLEELKEKNDRNIDQTLNSCAAIIDGKYIRELNNGKGLRGSSNQHCHIFKHHSKYRDIEIKENNLQTLFYDGKILTIGIPQSG